MERAKQEVGWGGVGWGSLYEEWQRGISVPWPPRIESSESSLLDNHDSPLSKCRRIRLAGNANLADVVFAAFEDVRGSFVCCREGIVVIVRP